MTDKMNRSTEHGLRSPANDGAPRPKPPRELQEGISKSGSKERPTVQRPSRNPPSQKPPKPTEYEQAYPPEMFSGYNQTPEMLAAEDAAKDQAVHRRGELFGLRRATRLICRHCREGRMATRPTGKWAHHEPRSHGWSHTMACNADPIHDEIARLEKEMNDG